MRLFPWREKTKGREERVKEPVPDADADAKADAPEDSSNAQTGPAPDVEVPTADPLVSDAAPAPPAEAAEAAVEPPQETPAAEGDLLSQIGAEADSELAAEEADAAGGSPADDDALDPELLDIFQDAKNEVQESTLAAELEDIPAQELLNDALGVSRRLGDFVRGRIGVRQGGAGERSGAGEDRTRPGDQAEP